jgi:CHASE2 domain-containing sensor protein/nitrogen-specific signal transduction histidine kinase
VSSDHSQRKIRLKREWLLTAIISFCLLAFLVFGDISRALSNVLYDHFMRLHGFKSTEEIVIVAVDDRTLSELGGWPIKRHQYAKLLRNLNEERYQPKAIGFDLLFLDSTADDIDLANQMSLFNAVLPLEFKVQEDAQQSYKPTLPVSPLATSASIGHINLAFDTDGVIRGIQTKALEWTQFGLLMHAKGDPNFHLTQISSGYQRFRMVDPGIGFPVVSLTDAINNRATRSLLKNKYVLLGVTTPSLGDRYPTLYSGKNNASTPGVAILASVLNASLNNALISEAPAFVVFGLASTLLFAMLQSLVKLRPRQALILAAAMMLCIAGLSYLALTTFNYWIDPVPFILIAILLQPLWAWRRLEAIVHLVKDKAADLQQFQPSERNEAKLNNRHSSEVVLQHAKLLDQAVQSVRSELSFLSAVIDEMPEAVAIFDANDNLLLVNRQLNLLVEQEHLPIGSQLTKFAFQLNIPLDLLSFSEIESGGSKSTLQISTQNGLKDFYLKTATIISPMGGHLLLVILMDITELKQSQIQRDRALQFLSHDMRTPIASILSLVRKSINSEVNNLEAQRGKIVHHANALLEMMDDFILTVSAEADQYAVKQELLDNLLNDAIERVADLAEAKGITLRDESEASNLFVMANTRLLVRAFVNLLFNAVKFAPTQSHILIQVSYEASGNTGRGNAIINICNPVEIKADSSDLIPSMPGFGLGLDFVDTVIQKHGGVVLRDIPNNGTAKVQITLPSSVY